MTIVEPFELLFSVSESVNVMVFVLCIGHQSAALVAEARAQEPEVCKVPVLAAADSLPIGEEPTLEERQLGRAAAAAVGERGGHIPVSQDYSVDILLPGVTASCVVDPHGVVPNGVVRKDALSPIRAPVVDVPDEEIKPLVLVADAEPLADHPGEVVPQLAIGVCRGPDPLERWQS